jgi:hypothetical protein
MFVTSFIVRRIYHTVRDSRKARAPNVRLPSSCGRAVRRAVVEGAGLLHADPRRARSANPLTLKSFSFREQGRRGPASRARPLVGHGVWVASAKMGDARLAPGSIVMI